MDEADGASASEQVQQLRIRICELQARHRELDEAIERLAQDALRDDLQLQRLKKRKLLLKDTIVQLQMALVPDIPA